LNIKKATNIPIPGTSHTHGDAYRDNQDCCIETICEKLSLIFFRMELLAKKQNIVDNIAIGWFSRQWSDNDVSVCECVMLCSVISFVCNHLINKLIRTAVYTDKSRAISHSSGLQSTKSNYSMNAFLHSLLV